MFDFGFTPEELTALEGLASAVAHPDLQSAKAKIASVQADVTKTQAKIDTYKPYLDLIESFVPAAAPVVEAVDAVDTVFKGISSLLPNQQAG